MFKPINADDENLNNHIMDNGINTWGVFWLMVATLGLVAVILGNHSHLFTILIGAIMMAVTGREEDNNQTH